MFEKIKIGLLYIGATLFMSIALLIIIPLFLVEEKPWKRRKMSEEERKRLEEKFRLGYISLV